MTDLLVQVNKRVGRGSVAEPAKFVVLRPPEPLGANLRGALRLTDRGRLAPIDGVLLAHALGLRDPRALCW